MGKGSNTTTTSTAPNAAAANAYYGLLDRAGSVANTPYQAYTGNLVAPINSQQNTGIAGINANAGFAQPYIQQAAGYATDAARAKVIEGYINWRMRNDPATQEQIRLHINHALALP